MQCGDFRIVSLMSGEAADDLGLSPGVSATAVVKATNVSIVTDICARGRDSVPSRSRRIGATWAAARGSACGTVVAVRA